MLLNIGDENMIEDIDKDYVVICDKSIKRPDRYSRSQWLAFWESIANEQAPPRMNVYTPPSYFKRARRAAR